MNLKFYDRVLAVQINDVSIINKAKILMALDLQAKTNFLFQISLTNLNNCIYFR